MKKLALFSTTLVFVIVSWAQNTGIGTTSPKAKLEVNGSINSPAVPGSASSGILRIAATNNGGIDMGISASPWIQAGFAGTASALNLQPMGGNIGVGTTNPLSKLDVNGILTLNNYELRLRDGNDANHGLKYNAMVDGPQLFGFSGGALGTANGTNALKWYAGGYAVINGAIAIDDAAQGDGNLANGFKFGGLSSNEGISSKRTAGGNQNGLDFYTNNQNRVSITSSGDVGIGTNTPSVSAKLDVSSTSQGFLPPRLTTLQRNAISNPATGLTIYNTDNKVMESYNGSVWSSSSGVAHYIGENYGGGIVFFVYDNGQHGLIAATADYNVKLGWTYDYLNTNWKRNDGLHIGRLNTDSINSRYYSGLYAAYYCSSYLGGGFGDWYLPSTYELNLLFLQKDVVGGFKSDNYWSSTPRTYTEANCQNFSSGVIGWADKVTNYYVRAIRSF